MMRIVVLVSIALLAAAGGYELYASGYSATALLDAFQSQTLLQKLAWAFIIVAPFVLLAATFWEAARHDQQRKAAAVLETRLRGAQKAVNELDDAQKDSDLAANYLERSDPEDAISGLQRRLIEAERTTHLQQSRNETQGLLDRVEQVRQQQQSLRERLGATIEKRRLIEPLFTELHTAQDDLDRRFAVLKADDLHERLRALTEAAEKMKSRCGAVEESVAAFVALKSELEALQQRLAPLDNRQTGVRSIISALQEVRDQLTVTIERLELDGEATLAGRASEFTETKNALEARVAGLLDQFSTLDQVNRDIRVLFTKLRGEVDAHFLSQNGGPQD
jgi:DNA repair exonuclease SbcCD ATPase subunit